MQLLQDALMEVAHGRAPGGVQGPVDHLHAAQLGTLGFEGLEIG
jgi:hypothetical protein